MADDRDHRKPPGRLNTAAGPLYDDVAPEDVTGRFTLIDSPVIRAVLLRLQQRIDEVADALRDENATGHGQIRDRVHKLAGDVQVLLLKLERLAVEMTGASGSNGKVGSLGVQLAEVRDATEAVHDEITELRQTQADHARSIRESDEARKGLSNRLWTLIGGAVLAAGAAGGAVWHAGGASADERSRVRYIEERTGEIRALQTKILAALCRVAPGLCADLISPAPSVPHGDPP